jgi:hypothetical protein
VFKDNLIHLFDDANAGAVIVVLGGRGRDYPSIYRYVDELASATGFSPVIMSQCVSSSDTPLSDLVYDEGCFFYRHLQSLSPNTDMKNEKLAAIHHHYERSRSTAPISSVRAYRKMGKRIRAKGRVP